MPQWHLCHTVHVQARELEAHKPKRPTPPAAKPTARDRYPLQFWNAPAVQYTPVRSMERAVLPVRLLLPLQCVAAIRLELSFALLSLALHSAREFAKNVPKPKVALKKDEDAIAADPSELDLLSMQASSDTRCLAFTWSVAFVPGKSDIRLLCALQYEESKREIEAIRREFGS